MIVAKEAKLTDSNELKSIGSSSNSEGDKSIFPKFNEIIDFSKPIDLKLKILFASIKIFRKALRQYAIK